MAGTMKVISREEKLEALADICEYDKKLIEAFKILADELESGRTDLQSKVFNQVMQGVNLTIEVLKQVMDLVTEEPAGLDVAQVNAALTAFNAAYEGADVTGLSVILKEKMVPAFMQICEAGAKIC